MSFDNSQSLALIDCIAHIRYAIACSDKDALRSYWEQANDIVCDLVAEEVLQ